MPLIKCALKGSIDAGTILQLSKGFIMIIGQPFHAYNINQSTEVQQDHQAPLNPADNPSTTESNQSEPVTTGKSSHSSLDSLGQGRLL
ncbi:hypothetical protein QFZ45_000356 [Pseudomonas synxantha]|nr:hypothetical protein [Pseudomonas synxantha]